MSIFDVRLHILSTDDTFDLATRRPSRPEGRETGQRGQQRNGTTAANV
jgi:hypothetical protein